MAIKINHNEIPGTVVEAKRWWRQEIRKAQKELSDEYMHLASEEIRRKLASMPEYRDARTVMLYVNAGKEVITRAMMSDANRQAKTVCLPLCTDTGNHVMQARLWNSEYRLSPGAYGIAEPSQDSPIVDPRDIDMVVLPCMSCDPNCNRLGHGAGYYDRYIPALREDCVTVAICYDRILAEDLPVEEHDEKVDYVITENNIYRSK